MDFHEQLIVVDRSHRCEVGAEVFEALRASASTQRPRR